MQNSFSIGSSNYGLLRFSSSEDSVLGSKVGMILRERGNRQQRSYFNSRFNYPPELEATVNELCDVADGCSGPNWDGEGATAVSESSLENACRFVLSLPRGCTMPESDADTDGEINLSWIGEKGHRLSLSIGSTGRISYAFRKGVRRLNGTVWFTERINEDILRLILTF